MTRFHTALLMVLLLFTGTAQAGSLPPPEGEIALTISGGVAAPNAGADLALDLAQVNAIGQATLITTTDFEWHEGPQTFSGPRMLDVLAAAGIKGGSVTVAAIDEYAVTMTIEDLSRYDALLATALNGTALTDESFGPLWLVFDYDAMGSAGEREAYKARSVWSVIAIAAE